MSKTRHFKALMRKNFINWKRSPVCSSFEIICPCLLMAILVYVRTLIAVKDLNLGGLDQYKHPAFPALIYQGNQNWAVDFNETNARVQDFFMYDNYTEQAVPNSSFSEFIFKETLEPKQTNGTPYSIEQDFSSPLYNLPTQCLIQFSFTRPAQTSPIIGVVNHGNLAQNIAVGYFNKLFNYQTKKAGLLIPAFKIKMFATKQDLWDYVESDLYYVARFGHDPLCYGFEIIENSPNSYEANLFFNDQFKFSGRFGIGIPSQKEPSWSGYIEAPNMESFENYQRRGYVFLHNIIANSVLLASSGVNTAQITLVSAPVPANVYIEDDFGQILTSMLPFFLLVMFIPPVYNLVFLIVKEKESKTRESMRMMGLTDTPYWLSWFIYYSCVNTVITTLAWLVLLFNVINYSQVIWWLFFFWLYGECVFGQILFMQSLFTRSKFAGLFATLIFFGGSLLNLAIQSTSTLYLKKLLLSLFPQVAMCQIASVIAEYESTGVGIRYQNLNSPYLSYTYNEGMLMLFVDLVLYSLLGLYLDKVFPKEFGQKNSCCFCLYPSYWGCCGVRREREVDDDEVARRSTINDRLTNTLRSFRLDPDSDDFEGKHLKKGNYEPVSIETSKLELQNQHLMVKNLYKTYANGFKAVQGINVKMYMGQIFALLGHNGAGKSSLISMITGLLEKSKGSGHVYGLDLFQQMDEVRQMMGVCPQHDILFEMLTPEEHLDIFYDFKGGNPINKEAELKKLISDVGLSIDREKQAGSLSGGNRRKLSVSIALCGGSKLVLLDEPTSGMDLQARRSLWNMLRNYRRDRIILLTTHYMDEADILGDRIGIMANGQLKCIGSSLFLKNRFSAGFKLTMVKSNKVVNKQIEAFLSNYFENFEKLSEIAAEITFLIPQKESSSLKNFFQDFDQQLEELGVKSYGVSITTLEEVFIKINEEFAPELFEKPEKTKSKASVLGSRQSEVQHQEALEKSELNTPIIMSSDSSQIIGSSAKVNYTQISSTFMQSNLMIDGPIEDEQEDKILDETLIRESGLFLNFYALCSKRISIYRRDLTGLICEFLVPVILFLIGLSFVNNQYLYNSPNRPLVTSQLPLTQRILMNSQVVNATGIDVPTPLEFYNNLPDVADSFSVTWSDSYNDYYSFYDEIAAQREITPVTPYRFGSFEIWYADRATQIYQVNAFVNVTSQDVAALYPQFIYQSILRTAMNDPLFNFTVSTEPFPVFYVFKEREKAGNAFDFAFMVGIGLSLIPTVIVSFILKEREENLKHMQLISGMNKCGYWLSNMIADMLKAYMPIFCIIVLTWIFNTNYAGVWVLYLLFPPAIVLFSYTFTFFFTAETMAQIIIFCINFLISGVMAIMVITLQIIPQTEHLGNQLRWWFCLIPSYCVTHGIIFSSSSSLIASAQPDFNTDLWAFQNLLGDALALVAHFFVGLIFLVIVETEIFSFLSKLTVWPIPPPKMDLVLDEDVIAEEQRVAGQKKHPDTFAQRPDDPEANLIRNTESVYDVIRVSGFRKAYTSLFGKPFLAVERVSFGLDYGECFALLGVNGAGKSSTFKSLTGDTLPTTGEITISGFDVAREFKDARKLIGYCPQKDAIFPLLTVEEHLWFYARIKGVPQNLRQKIVEKYILEMNLKDHRTKPAGTLSGGNKRKLSVAIAILGNPPIILLDEPSAGMDPEARRFMWSVVEKISQRDKKSAVILTTHSMEEAEALSTKMGIMVRGGIFRCFGSSQHIKNKYGTGFEIQLKIRKAIYEDQEQIITMCGFTEQLGQTVELLDAIEKCRKANINQIILDQIKENGLGSDLSTEAAANNGRVSFENLISYLFVQMNGVRIIDILARIFAQVELLEQCADYYKLKVPRQDVTIGYLFGLIEDKKDVNNISEYSVTQTSLEQIFQNFANLDLTDKASLTYMLNETGKLTLVDGSRRTLSVQPQYVQPPISSSKIEDDVMLLKPRPESNDGKVPTKSGDSGV